MAPPRGDANPPRPVAYTMVSRIFDAVLFDFMSSIPMYFNIATAIGVMVAHTTAFGRTAESVAASRNQNTS